MPSLPALLPASAAFVQAQGRYFLLELAATGLFYVIIVMWMLR